MLADLCSITCKGRIALQRQDRHYEAAFCIIQDTLPSLTNDFSFLHENESAYYNGLPVDKRRLSYLLGRKAAKTAVAELTAHADLQSIEIGSGVFQFPIVKTAVAQNLQVSISHCDKLGVAVAFQEEHPMGVDIERIDHGKKEVMKTYVSVNETVLIENNQLSVSAGATAMWTIKEALSKILKTGLTVGGAILEVKTFEKYNEVYISTFRHFIQYKAISLPAGDYVCSIVLPKNTKPALENFCRAFSNIVNRVNVL